MHSTKIFAIVAVLVTSALASPAAWEHPPPPPPPKINIVTQQTNYCGNGVTAYCCDNEGGLLSKCVVLGKLSSSAGATSGTITDCKY